MVLRAGGRSEGGEMPPLRGLFKKYERDLLVVSIIG